MSPDDRSGDRPDREARAGRETRASRRARTPERDPRDIVTEYAFQVDRRLLGVPLAGSLRRLLAMAVDLLLVAMVFGAKEVLDAMLGGTTDLLIAALGGLLLWSIGGERKGETLTGRAVRWGLKAAAGLVTGIALIVFFATLGQGEGGGPDPDDVQGTVRQAAAAGAAAGSTSPAGVAEGPLAGGSWRDAAGVALQGAELARADGPEEAQPTADRLAARLQRMGLPPREIQESLREELAADTARPWMTDVVERAVARAESLAALRTQRRDSVTELWLRARAAGDTAEARAMRPEVLRLVAGDSLAALRSVRRENRELENRVADLESTGGFLRQTLNRIANELGLGYASLALYFTFLLKIFRGSTPGKRLLGVRVVKLNGEPISWWDAISRYGGYWAGAFTGLLGWLQVLWDPNRQAMHDKIAGTVAIRTRGPGKRYEPPEG